MWFRSSLIIIFINKANDPNYFHFLLKVLCLPNSLQKSTYRLLKWRLKKPNRYKYDQSKSHTTLISKPCGIHERGPKIGSLENPQSTFMCLWMMSWWTPTKPDTNHLAWDSRGSHMCRKFRQNYKLAAVRNISLVLENNSLNCITNQVTE